MYDEIPETDQAVVESLCVKFRQGLQGDDESTIEQMLDSAPARLQPIVFRALLAEELLQYHSAGKVPPAERYIQRFPAHSDLVNDVYKQVLSGTSETYISTSATDNVGDATMAVASDADSAAGPEVTHQAVDASKPASASAVEETLAPPDGGNQPGKGPGETHDTMALLSSQSVVPAVEHGKAYRVESEIDRGGMGVVLKVHDVQLQRTLAMKLIIGQEDLSSSATNTPSADKLARFIREAEITGRLDHPGVVPVHEMARDEHGRLYFTMKFVQGKTLAKVLSELKKGKGHWTQARVLEILIRVCDTIAFAHSKGVIHRDLKPANVMVGEFGETYVMDWGLAKLMNEAEEPLDQAPLQGAAAPRQSFSETMLESATIRGSAASSRSATMDGSVLGTPQFMPPEQATGRVSELDERADIYSIGALLYRVLTDCNPYHDHTSASAVVRAVSVSPPTRISQLNRKAPAELVAIAEKAMQRSKHDRYATALAMADDLRAFLDNRVVGAYRTGARAKFEKWVVRNRNILTTAVLLLFGGLSSIAYLQFKNSREVSAKNDMLGARSKQLAQRGEELAKRQDELEIALVEQEKASRKEQAANDRLWGRKLVFDATRAIEGSSATLATLLAIEAVEQYNYLGEESQSALYRVAERLNEGLIFRGHQAEVTNVALSPDGKRAVSVSKDGSGIVWDVDTGAESAMLFSKSDWFDGVSFMMGGKRILAWSRSGTVDLFVPDTGTRIRSWELGISPDSNNARSDITGVCLYPDQQRFAAANDLGEVFVIDAEQAEVIAVVSGGDEQAKPIDNIRVSPTGTRIVAGCQNGRILLWDAETYEPITVSQAEDLDDGAGQPIGPLSFNSDGSLFVAGTISVDVRNSQPVRVWDAESGELRAEISSGNAITAAAFHASRKDLLLLGVQGNNDSRIAIWDFDQTEVVAQSVSLSGVVRHIRFAPGSGRFLTMTDNASLSAWDVVIERSEPPSIQHVDSFGDSTRSRINGATFSSDGSRVASAATDTTVRIWNVDSKRAVPRLGWYGRKYSLRISPAADRILVLDPDWRRGHLWTYPDAEHLAELDLGSPLSHWGFSPDGKLIFTGTMAGECRVWDAISGSLMSSLQDVAELYAFGFDASEQRLCLRSRERTSIWNFADRSVLYEFKTEQGDLPILAADGGSIFVHNFAKQTLKWIDPKTGEIQPFDSASVMAGQYSPDQSLFWCKGEPDEFRGRTARSVNVLESATGNLKYAFEDESGQSRPIKHAEFSRDSSKILLEYFGNPDLGETGDAFSIRSLRDGKEICQLGEYTSHLVGGSPDFSRLILRSSKATRMYDGKSGSTIRLLTPTVGSFSYADFSPGDEFFLLQEARGQKQNADAQQQARVSIREAQTGNLIANLPGNQQMHGILADGKAILTVSSDRQVRLWPIDVLSKCKSLAARSLTPAEQLDYLGEVSAPSDLDQRLGEWREFERRIRLLTPITPERRKPVWAMLEQLRDWLGEHPAEEELATAIASVQPLITEAYDTDPNVLAEIASVYEVQGDGAAVVKLLEQAVRHPRATSDQERRLVAAREQIAPIIVSYASAAALAERLALGAGTREFSAAQQWADENDPALAAYLKAHRLSDADQPQQAATLLAPLVADKPLAPEPYLLQARCLRRLQQAGDAADVLRQALEIDQCRSPEVWKLWLQIAFADLGQTPEDLLSRCPPPLPRISSDEPFGDGVHWLLTQLNDSKPLRINSGGREYLFKDGQAWSQDRFFTHGYGFFENAGEAGLFAGTIANTDHPLLYRSERWFRQSRQDLPAGYQIPLPQGNYRVILGFAEIYAEDRSFDVLIEDQTALRNYDPANGEFATADLATIDAEVTDGLLDIELRSNNDTNPKISTVQVIPLFDEHTSQ